MEIDLATAERLLRVGAFNLIRRGADGSLVMSADRWQLASVTPDDLRFAAQPPAPTGVSALVVARSQVKRITWDRLPKQRARSQVSLHLRAGDIWTFSGHFEEPAAGL